MNKLVITLMIRYCVLLLVGVIVALTEPKSPQQVAVKDIAELKTQGSSGIFQVAIIGSTVFDGLALLAAKAQCLDDPAGDGWFESYRARAVPLGERFGKAFLFFTENRIFSNYPIRHLITARFPSNGSCSVEVAKTGAVFRIDEKTAPSDQEVHSFVLYFDEPHATAADLSSSVWDLTFKYRKTEPVTGDTDSYQGSQQLKRESGDQLWIQVTGSTVALRSAIDYQAAQEKEQPDHTIDRLIALIIKRLDLTK